MRDHLATLLDDFRRFGRETAVVRYQGNRRRVTSYGELARLSGRFAALLVERGIGPGERVLVWGENSAEWIAAFHGCMLRGVLAVPLDARGTAEFAARVAADVGPKLAVGDAVLMAQLTGVAHKLAFEDWLAVLPASEAGPVEQLSAETPLEILFTSGTTGEPKGIVLTHGNVLASVGPIENGAQPYLRWERLVHPLRILHTLPLSHVFGQTMGLWVPPIFAGEVHFEERLVAPRLVETIRRERISVLAAVPRVLALLKTHLELAYPGLAERVAASAAVKVGGPRRWWRFRRIHRAFGLKFWALISGGGALAGGLEQFWNAMGFVLVQGYGMTESTALITLNHPFHVTAGTIGKPLAGREVKLGPDGEVLVRGAAISRATWSGGSVHRRKGEWLATGDLAKTEASGELRFLGRKSEVIVTPAGVNIHPEDLESVIEEQPGVAACAVVAMETPEGPEPCAVLACRGRGNLAAAAIESANARLAEFQRLRRWVLWPEPDLPRTSTGKVRRKVVEAWLRKIQAAASAASDGNNGHRRFGASQDWLLALIAEISGEAHPGVGDELHLTEDLHLDSLGRVQLAAAIEDRLGFVAKDGILDGVQTLGALRRLVAGEEIGHQAAAVAEQEKGAVAAQARSAPGDAEAGATKAAEEWPAERARGHYFYPVWPWLAPLRWMRSAFKEALMRPLVWLLANPRVKGPAALKLDEPLLIIANHVTAFDVPLIEYALPGALRRRLAVAMSGELLEDYRHFRNAEPLHPSGRFFLPGPLFYFLLTALFNVFPLPRRRDFQPSFAHAGRAMDRGFSVLVFPEGMRSAEGKLARFRPGIGLLAKQCGAPVLPVAIRGLGELKTGGRGWFRSGSIEVRVGEPMGVLPTESEGDITTRLQAEVERLMEDGSAARGDGS
jgi:long-chain acyl-CoA synthetase